MREAAVVHAGNLRRVFAGFSVKERQVLDALLDRLRTVQIG